MLVMGVGGKGWGVQRDLGCLQQENTGFNTHPRLLKLSLYSPCNFRFRGGGLPTSEHSMPRARHEKQASSSSLITHLDRRCWQLSQGQAGNPADGDPTQSGVSKPPLLKLPGKVSGWALPERLEASLEAFGAIAMGADLEMALGIDILED